MHSQAGRLSISATILFRVIRLTASASAGAHTHSLLLPAPACRPCAGAVIHQSGLLPLFLGCEAMRSHARRKLPLHASMSA